MVSKENVVPSVLYTAEGKSSKKRTEEELDVEDPEKELGIAIVSNSKEENHSNNDS